MSKLSYDVIVIGGGLIGTAAARELGRKFPQLKLAIVEKEKSFACHQSGHNSGVVHAGIYYKPKTLKARLCVEGLALTYKYCDEKNIPYRKCGKLIVAVSEKEVPLLQSLFDNGIQNGIKDLVLLDAAEIKDIEPNCQGLKALWSPNTGIVDYVKVNESYGEDCRKQGCEVHFNFSVHKFTQDADANFPVLVCSEDQRVLSCKFVVICAGLYSDKLAFLSGCSSVPKIIPFRGDYLVLRPEKSNLVKTNIYPVHNPMLPFLGVHFTPRMDGSIWLGPNAILAFKREGYKPTDINFSETYEILRYKGFQKLAKKHFWYGLRQMYGRLNMGVEIAQLQKYVPKLQKQDVIRGPSGVRAQALSEDGTLVDDFLFDSGTSYLGERILNVRNAPSPAATSSLAIAKIIVNRIKTKFNLS